MSPEIVGDDAYLNILIWDWNSKNVNGPPFVRSDRTAGWAGRFVLWKYEVAGDTLKVWPMSQERLQNSLQSKQATGGMEHIFFYWEFAVPVLSGSPGELKKLLIENGDTLFAEKPTLYRRLPESHDTYAKFKSDIFKVEEHLKKVVAPRRERAEAE